MQKNLYAELVWLDEFTPLDFFVSKNWNESIVQIRDCSGDLLNLRESIGLYVPLTRDPPLVLSYKRYQRKN